MENNIIIIIIIIKEKANRRAGGGYQRMFLLALTSSCNSLLTGTKIKTLPPLYPLTVSPHSPCEYPFHIFFISIYNNHYKISS